MKPQKAPHFCNHSKNRKIKAQSAGAISDRQNLPWGVDGGIERWEL